MSMISSQTHLATPDDFSDNCGFGLIAHIKGEASHNLVKTAIHSLSCMTHRGGVAADGRTGDGCGLLLATPLNRSLMSSNSQSQTTLLLVWCSSIWMMVKPSIASKY